MKLIHNRYEDLVIKMVIEEGAKWPVLSKHPDLLADAACIALNSLRPHYIRHPVDLSFYMPDEQRAEEQREVSAAVMAALAYVLHDKRVGLPT